MTVTDVKRKKSQKTHRIIDTKQPTVFFESPARLKIGRFSYINGNLVLTSKTIFFVDQLHHRQFDIDLHAIDDLYFWRNNRVFEITHRKKRHIVLPGLFSRRYVFYCALGLLFGVIPGILVYHYKIDPQLAEGKKLTKKLKSTMAHHAIRIDD
jgi:hypothetical protein